jgi:hypothetical protein
MPITWKKSIKKAIQSSVGSMVNCKICGLSCSFMKFRTHIVNEHNMSCSEYYLTFIDSKGDLCLCGCQKSTKWTNLVGGRFADYLHGHNLKNLSLESTNQRSESMKKSWNEGKRKGGFRDPNVRSKSAISRSKTMKRLYAEGKLILPNMKISSDDRKNAAIHAYETICSKYQPPGGWSKIKRGWYFSSKSHQRFFYQSNWELIYMKSLDKDPNVMSWEHPAPRIAYKDPETHKSRWYYPDFWVTYYNICDQIVEIKGQITTLDLEKFKFSSEWTKQNNMQYCVLGYHESTKMFYDQEINK